MIDINLAKKYWNNFYKSNKLTKKESNFASFCYEFTKTNRILNAIDVGSGNFRDSFFFFKKKIQININRY